MLFIPSSSRLFLFVFFFFNDTATTEIYTLSLHDALPISTASARAPSARCGCSKNCSFPTRCTCCRFRRACCSAATWSSTRWARCRCCATARDRKSTRLNSSHLVISYAVFCLKKKIRPLPDRHHVHPFAYRRDHLPPAPPR